MNEYFAGLEQTEFARLKTRTIFKIYNQNGVSTETAAKILKETSEALAEIENLYGGGDKNNDNSTN